MERIIEIDFHRCYKAVCRRGLALLMAMVFGLIAGLGISLVFFEQENEYMVYSEVSCIAVADISAVPFYAEVVKTANVAKRACAILNDAYSVSEIINLVQTNYSENLISGVPIHNAIATNKLSSSCGTALTTVRFIRQGIVNWKLAIPTIIFAMLGSSLGANLSLKMDERIMQNILFVVLPVVAFVVMNPKLFRDQENAQLVFNSRLWITAISSAFLIGIYDGFYGPGTGTFLIIAFTVIAKMDMRSANAQAKVINLTTNITSLTIFLINGQAILLLGLAAAACNMAGNYVGSGLAMKQGSKVTRPVIILVLILLFLKVLGIL